MPGQYGAVLEAESLVLGGREVGDTVWPHLHSSQELGEQGYLLGCIHLHLVWAHSVSHRE